MSEYVPEDPEDTVDPESADAGGASGQEFGDPVRTGVAEVDAVLDSVADLEERPVAEHVAVFEDAHERLRRALDGRSDA